MKISLLIPVLCLMIGAPALAIDPPFVRLQEADIFVDPVSEPVPQGNPGEWVTSNDYPAAALRNEWEGISEFRLIVDKLGNTANCLITKSSGFEVLDEGTCKVLLERAKFVPAADDQGQPVVGAWDSRVLWQIPEQMIISVPGSQYWIATYTVDDDGSVSSCKMEKAEGEAVGYDFCGQLPQFYPGLNKDGQPVRKRIQVFHRLVEEDLPQ